MIGVIEVDEKDVSDDGYIILEYPIRPLTKSMQEYIRIKTNIKLIDRIPVGFIEAEGEG